MGAEDNTTGFCDIASARISSFPNLSVSEYIILNTDKASAGASSKYFATISLGQGYWPSRAIAFSSILTNTISSDLITSFLLCKKS